MMFCYLTDASLQFGVFIRRGVVRFANSYLAQKFCVSAKTIQNWKRSLLATGHVWVTEKRMKNSFPMTVYNIAAIVGAASLPANGDSEDGYLIEDVEAFSNRRPARSLARGEDGKWQRREFTPPARSLPKNRTNHSQSAASEDRARKILPSTTATSCRPPRQPVAVHHGKPLPTATATSCRPPRQTIAVHDGNQLPLPTATSCRSPRQPIADKGKAQAVGGEVFERGEPDTPPRPDVSEAFKKWETRLDDMKNGHLRALESKIKARLQTTRSEIVRSGLKAQLQAVQDRLLPPVLDVATATPATATPAQKEKPTPIPIETRRKLWAEAKAKNFASGPECVGSGRNFC